MSSSATERNNLMVGTILVERGLLSTAQLEHALRLQAETGGLLGEIIEAELGVSQAEISRILAEEWEKLDEHDRTSSAEFDYEPAGRVPVRMGDTLVELGLASREQIVEALEV